MGATKVHLVLLLIAACNSETSPGPTNPTGFPPVGFRDSVNVKDYGALGDGQRDDTAAFKSALAALGPSGGVVRVPAGIYVISPSSGTPDRGIDLSGRTNITILGAGAGSTTLRLAAGSYRGDTHLMFLLESSNIRIADMALDGNRLNASFVDEQNHCVEVWRGSTDLVFERVHFHHCRGDGIRLIGPTSSSAPWTERITIGDSRFEDNGRSGIAVQRGVRNLRILNNTFQRISDQSIDMEPTGDAGDLAPTDILVEGNVIHHTTQTWAVALGGVSSSDVMRRVSFSKNRVEGGAVLFGKIDSLVIRENTIAGDPNHSALRLARNATNVSIVGNVIAGSGGGEEGLVQVVAFNDAHPQRITLRDNSITASAGQTGVFVRDALGDIEISANRITGTGGNSGIHIASIAALGDIRVRFSVVDNEIENFGSGIHFSAREDQFNEVTVQDNSIDWGLQAPIAGSRRRIGILFDTGNPYRTFATVRNNNFGLGIMNAILDRAE